MTAESLQELIQSYYDEVYAELKQMYDDGEYHKPTMLDGELLALRRVLNWIEEKED